MTGQDLVLVKKQIALFDQRNLVNAQQANASALANALDFSVDGRGIDFIRYLAQQSQQDCSIRTVSVTGESQGNKQLDADRGYLV